MSDDAPNSNEGTNAADDIKKPDTDGTLAGDGPGETEPGTSDSVDDHSGEAGDDPRRGVIPGVAVEDSEKKANADLEPGGSLTEDDLGNFA
jgi:hypothetical protein